MRTVRDCRQAQPPEIKRKLTQTRAEHGIFTPASVLAGTTTRIGWNEVILSAAGDAERPLRVKGLFLMVDEKDKMLDNYRRGNDERQVYATAAKLGLPVTRITRTDPSEGPTFEVRYDDSGTEVQQITLRDKPKLSQVDFESQLRRGEEFLRAQIINNPITNDRTNVDIATNPEAMDPLITRLRVEMRRDRKLARAIERSLARLACTPGRASETTRYLNQRLLGN